MDLKLLGNYYIWAEEQIRNIIIDLSEEEMLQKNDKFGRSVRDLVEHLWVTYESYFHELTQESFKKIAEKAKNMSTEDLMNNWVTGTSKFAKAMVECEKEEFTFPISKEKSLTVKKEDYFLLYTDHQTYHRGQIVALLKILGKEGINTDYFTHIVSKPQ